MRALFFFLAVCGAIVGCGSGSGGPADGSTDGTAAGDSASANEGGPGPSCGSQQCGSMQVCVYVNCSPPSPGFYMCANANTAQCVQIPSCSCLSCPAGEGICSEDGGAIQCGPSGCG